ncbi:hypothetical protein VC83_02455 [Pseudogymnoascus destructans]|uniref:Uncharacterized protein n=1 Tax=Pseudogymnoascus destructans TaxID=655981 RepID=A0A177AIF0_9PEZI|nr:uncharacterized protein VC83_02455 [Pseudogymnoascus destructans]OAF61232.1 hypothetical protein VC83_02455 [Pseudogymnoascus destructans]
MILTLSAWSEDSTITVLRARPRAGVSGFLEWNPSRPWMRQWAVLGPGVGVAARKPQELKGTPASKKGKEELKNGKRNSEGNDRGEW